MTNQKGTPKGIRTVAVSTQSGSTQGALDLGIEKQADVSGIGMGVLSDGTPYLRACLRRWIPTALAL
jgi:hypothetical protein